MISLRSAMVTTALSAMSAAWTPSFAYAQSAPVRPAPEAGSPTFTAGWQEGPRGEGGFVLQSGNGDYRLAIGIVAQTDGRFSVDNSKPITDTFLIRKLRPTFSGRVAKHFDFKLMPDFGNGHPSSSLANRQRTNDCSRSTTSIRPTATGERCRFPVDTRP